MATLTDRYIAAAMRTVPEDQRTDLGAELRASIDDQIDARVEDGMLPADAERDVLTDLGDPEKLAAGYTDRKLALIGPRYYLDWWRLLKLLWAIVPACAVFGVALGMTIAGEGFGEIAGTVWAVLLGTVVHIGFWTTLVFALVERYGKNAPMGSAWTLESLPEPREKGLGFSDMVASLVFLLIAAGAIVWDHFIGFVPDRPGLSFLDDGLWPWAIAVLFALMALEAIFAVVLYLGGRWTPALAVANTLLALAVAVPAVVLLLQGRLLNGDYLPTLIGSGSGVEVQAVVATLTGFFLAGVALWDIIDGWRKLRRDRRAA